MVGNPDTMAAGGRSLEYYLGVNLKCISNKTKDLIKDEHENVLGITGKIRNTKNKVSVPHRECAFELIYDEGLNKVSGLLDHLVKSRVVEKNKGWYTYKEKKFERFKGLREEIGIISDIS